MPNQPLRVSIACTFAVALLLCTTTVTAQTSNCTAGSSVPAKAVCSAAESLLATLSATQRNGIQFAFDRTTASSKWSNLPCGAACRNGLQFSTLSATQSTSSRAASEAAGQVRVRHVGQGSPLARRRIGGRAKTLTAAGAV